jgi:heterodisulfide reductase subunit A-like polyferredoxin
MLGSRLPAGASPLSLVKEEDACIHCGNCSLACPFGITEVADARRTGRLALADCALCGECVAACPREGALSLRFFGYALSSSRGRKRGRDGMSPESGEEVLVKCGG